MRREPADIYFRDENVRCTEARIVRRVHRKQSARRDRRNSSGWKNNGTANCKLKRWKNMINLARIARFPAFYREKQRRIKRSALWSDSFDQTIPTRLDFRPISANRKRTQVFTLIKVSVNERNLIGNIAFASCTTKNTTFNFYMRACRQTITKITHCLLPCLFVRTNERSNL